ncbi:MAG: transcription repressor NadR [Lachnospiraceae bacterium]|nr:transcription repressor NadR [Lachnospiraceae bacterium]
MNGEERRKQILRMIEMETISGTKLAQQFHVSRQVIVQDIALLRSAGADIISTNRGYMLQCHNRAQRVFAVKHSDAEIERELKIMVDAGGFVEDVIITHEVYGDIRAELNIGSRKQVQEFIADMQSGMAVPLKNLTEDEHRHTVTAESEDVLCFIEDELRRVGILVE